MTAASSDHSNGATTDPEHRQRSEDAGDDVVGDEDADDAAVDDDRAVGDDQVASRAELRPSERRAGSDDPKAQARAILEESEERKRAASTDSTPDGAAD